MNRINSKTTKCKAISTYRCTMSSSFSRVQFWRLEFLNSSHVSLLVQIFNLIQVDNRIKSLKRHNRLISYLGFSKDNVSVRCRVFVYIRFVDDKKNVTGLADGYSTDSCHLQNHVIQIILCLMIICYQLTCLRPSLDIIFLAFFSPLLCFALLTSSSGRPAAAATYNRLSFIRMYLFQITKISLPDSVRQFRHLLILERNLPNRNLCCPNHPER